MSGTWLPTTASYARSLPLKREFQRAAPETTVLAVGDIHGCFKILREVFRAASQEKIVLPSEQPNIVFLGDYIDRGEQSDAVLIALHALQKEFPDKIICLQGNHEQMMLGFLDAPEQWGGLWLSNGGLQTLSSFGVGRVSETSSGNALIAARNQLRQKLPCGVEDWLRNQPKYWQSGNLIFSHAGAHPNRPISDQDDAALVWGESEFLSRDRSDGIWIVHGHNAVTRAGAMNGRVAIDTGAYFSGILTIAVIKPSGEINFFSS